MMTNRSTEKELLDKGLPYYSLMEYEHCQKILFKINKLLGIFSSTRRILKKFSPGATVADIGCGAGTFLLHLSSYFSEMKFYGTDISKEAIAMAKQQLKFWKKSKHPHIDFYLQSKNDLTLKNNTDIILLTLIMHHLSDTEIICFLNKINQRPFKLIVINDLHRHAIAYYFFKIFSSLFFNNRLIKHDGLISIRRSFTRDELNYFLKKSNIERYEIKWRFPFWWRILIWKR